MVYVCYAWPKEQVPECERDCVRPLLVLVLWPEELSTIHHHPRLGGREQLDDSLHTSKVVLPPTPLHLSTPRSTSPSPIPAISRLTFSS